MSYCDVTPLFFVSLSARFIVLGRPVIPVWPLVPIVRIPVFLADPFLSFTFLVTLAILGPIRFEVLHLLFWRLTLPLRRDGSPFMVVFGRRVFFRPERLQAHEGWTFSRRHSPRSEFSPYWKVAHRGFVYENGALLRPGWHGRRPLPFGRSRPLLSKAEFRCGHCAATPPKLAIAPERRPESMRRI